MIHEGKGHLVLLARRRFAEIIGNDRPTVEVELEIDRMGDDFLPDAPLPWERLSVPAPEYWTKRLQKIFGRSQSELKFFFEKSADEIYTLGMQMMTRHVDPKKVYLVLKLAEIKYSSDAGGKRKVKNALDLLKEKCKKVATYPELAEMEDLLCLLRHRNNEQNRETIRLFIEDHRELIADYMPYEPEDFLSYPSDWEWSKINDVKQWFGELEEAFENTIDDHIREHQNYLQQGNVENAARFLSYAIALAEDTADQDLRQRVAGIRRAFVSRHLSAFNKWHLRSGLLPLLRDRGIREFFEKNRTLLRGFTVSQNVLDDLEDIDSSEGLTEGVHAPCGALREFFLEHILSDEDHRVIARSFVSHLLRRPLTVPDATRIVAIAKMDPRSKRAALEELFPGQNDVMYIREVIIASGLIGEVRWRE